MAQGRVQTDQRGRHALALYVIVAWRIHPITMAGRAAPEVSCEVVFAPPGVAPPVYDAASLPLAADPPPLREMVRSLAQRAVFSPDFLEQAEQLVRQRPIPYHLRQRATLVLRLHHQPLLSHTQAGAQVQLHPNSVRLWRRRWANGHFSLEDEAGRGVSPGFPRRDAVIVKAIACEAVAQTQLPLRRLSLADLATQASTALGQPISCTTVGRILDAEAIQPWRYEYWRFPRDPQFAEQAGRVLDLDAGLWHGQPLGPHDSMIRAAEKTSRQARRRCHPSWRPAPGRKSRVEHEYDGGGARQYLAAWDGQRGYIMGRCEPSPGIEPFGRLVSQVMEQEPYRSAERVFWVVDNGSSHRGHTAVCRLCNADANAMLVHTPVHASWLNQVEISFSIVQRTVLTPNDFASVEAVEQRLRRYEALSNQQPRPFAWQFPRATLAECLKRLAAHAVMIEQGQAVPELPDMDQDEPLAA